MNWFYNKIEHITRSKIWNWSFIDLKKKFVDTHRWFCTHLCVGEGTHTAFLSQNFYTAHRLFLGYSAFLVWDEEKVLDAETVLKVHKRMLSTHVPSSRHNVRNKCWYLWMFILIMKQKIKEKPFINLPKSTLTFFMHRKLDPQWPRKCKQPILELYSKVVT